MSSSAKWPTVPEVLQRAAEVSFTGTKAVFLETGTMRLVKVHRATSSNLISSLRGAGWREQWKDGHAGRRLVFTRPVGVK